MKLLKIGKYLINPQCMVQAWTNCDASEIKVWLSCNNSVVGVESLCLRENEGQLEKVEDVCVTFIGEEAEVLKSYFTNSEDICPQDSPVCTVQPDVIQATDLTG
jgi:hypothetical protein